MVKAFLTWKLFSLNKQKQVPEIGIKTSWRVALVVRGNNSYFHPLIPISTYSGHGTHRDIC
jgi:hypothetical protein